MHINKKINKNFFLYFSIFFIFLLVGLNSYKDYGISIDENYHQINGEHYYSFFKGLFLNNPEFLTLNELKQLFKVHSVKDPAIFDFSVAALTEILNIKDTKSIYLFRHLSIFLIFLIGLFYFYLILKKRFNNDFIIVIGLLFLFLSPRIFANSFYNNKDLIFLSVTCIFLYYSIIFLEKPSPGKAIIFGVFSSLAFDIRIMAIIYIFAFYLMFFFNFLDEKNLFINKFLNLLLGIISTIFFLYLFWPYLWIDPIKNLIDYFSVIKSATPAIQNLYLGDYIFTKSSPWHYDIIWILFTSPLTIVILFIIGFLLQSIHIFKNFMNVEKKDHKFWYNKKELIDFYIFLAFTLIFFMRLKFGVNYDGWRQIYFLYPLIIILGLYGLEYLKRIINNTIIIKFLFIIVFLELIFLSIWNYKNHPYQFVYFNPIFKSLTKNNFELDYWGISNRSVLEQIFHINEKNDFKVATISYTSLNDSLRILDPKIREKISIVYDLNDADYVIDNHRKKWSSTPGEENLEKDFSIIYSLIVDGNIINTVYKKN